MSLVSRRSPLALKSCVSATLGIRTPSFPWSLSNQFDSPRTSTPFRRQASYKARATRTLKPGVYTLEDLMEQPSRQQLELHSLESYTLEGTRPQLNEQIQRKEHAKTLLTRYDENHEEVSCPL